MGQIKHRIKDFEFAIADMNPVQIYINRHLVWDDENFDVSAITKEQALEASREHRKQFFMTLQRDDLVKSIKYNIVHAHHSIVYIETEK